MDWAEGIGNVSSWGEGTQQNIRGFSPSEEQNQVSGLGWRSWWVRGGGWREQSLARGSRGVDVLVGHRRRGGC